MNFCPGCGDGDEENRRLERGKYRRTFCKSCEAGQRRERRNVNPEPSGQTFSTTDESMLEDRLRDPEFRYRFQERQRLHSMPRAGKSTVLCVPDIHFPWHSERGLALTLDIVQAAQPDLVIQLGDLYDLF